MPSVPFVPAGSGPRRRLAVAAALLAVAGTGACSSDSPAPGAAAATAAADTTSAPAGPKVAASVAPSRVVSTRSAAKADPRADIAAATVTRFYSAYIASPGRQTASGYLTPQLLDELFSTPRDYDRVLCAHALPNAITTAPGAVKGKNALVTVTSTQQGVVLPSLQVTVRMADQRIVKIACPV